jgi:hypothetical protein
MLQAEYNKRVKVVQQRRAKELEQLVKTGNLPVGHCSVRGWQRGGGGRGRGARSPQHDAKTGGELVGAFAWRSCGGSARSERATPPPPTHPTSYPSPHHPRAHTHPAADRNDPTPPPTHPQAPDGTPGRSAVLLELRKLRLYSTQVGLRSS